MSHAGVIHKNVDWPKGLGNGGKGISHALDVCNVTFIGFNPDTFKSLTCKLRFFLPFDTEVENGKVCRGFRQRNGDSLPNPSATVSISVEQ